MRAREASRWFTLSVRVNGIEFHQASLRRCGDRGTSFEVLIRDRHLGSFALHEEFVLEIPRGHEPNARWCHVSLVELREAVRREGQMSESDFVANASAGSSPFYHLQRPPHRHIERITVEGDSSHLERLQMALLHGRIHYQIVGGLDSLGRCGGHLTVAVSSTLRVGKCLLRAGFLESPESKLVLVDSSTGWKVRLLEGRRNPQL